MRVLGVDACRAGWVAVELVDGGFAAAHLAATLGELPSGVAAVGVDMPLGLVESGWREADDLARRQVGTRRRNSVFSVPPGPVWAEDDYAAANRRCRELVGAGMSRQAFALRVKLREAQAYRVDRPVYEVHPEVSFRAMAGRELQHSKATWAGHVERRSLLAGQGIVLHDELGEAGRAGPDDVLDAAAAAWSAHRMAAGRAASLPDPPQRAGGLQIAIWY